MDQIGSILIKQDQTGQNLFKLDQIGSNWFKLDQQVLTVVTPFCNKLLQICNTLNDFRMKFEGNFDQIIFE